MADIKRQFLISKKNIWLVLIFTLIVTIELIVLLILMILNIISWSWITGFLISAVISGISLFILHFGSTILVKTENHYFYLFLLIIRLGLYLIPFLLVFFVKEGQVFNLYGSLIGLSPIIIYPFIAGFSKNMKES